MVMSVNTNISSLNAQKNLASSQSKLATAISRLSSGMRINSAKDDAAGLAISTRFTTQINGLNQAVSNANDGISLAQTTESALNEVTNNMQRIRTLAVQSANATNSDSDRQALDAEVQQRLSEITRISQQTTFNGRHVLDGTFGNAAFQIGANVGETISVNLSQGAGAAQVGKVASAASDISSQFTSAGTAATSGTYQSGAVTLADYSTTNATFDVNGTTVTLNTDYTAGGKTLSDMASDIQTQLTGFTVAAAGGKLTITNSTTGAASAVAITNDSAGIFTGGTATAGADAVAAAPASLTLAAGDLSLNGTDITGTFKDTQSVADAINSKGLSGVSAFVDDSGKLKIESQSDLTIAGTKAGTGAGNLGFTTGTTVAAGSLSGSNVKTVAGANDTINRIDSALSAISSMRSDLGAVQNRFDSTISNLQTISQNLSSSRSQIQDADFAAETANMSSANILQQAGVSVLAQANSTTQSVLKLLQ